MTTRDPGTPSVALRPGAPFEVRIEDLTSEGAGVARLGALVVFVPGAVPKDLVRGRIRRLRRGYAEAELTRVVEPSPDRIEPACPHQPVCGGCPLMVLPAGPSLALKVAHLEQALRRIGGIDLAVTRTRPSPAALGYRGRVRFAVAPPAQGAVFGYRPRGIHDALVPIDACLLAPPRASELARAVLSALIAQRTPGPSPGGPRPWLAQLELRGSHARGEWLAVLHTGAGRWPEAAAAARDLCAREPDLAGVVRVIDAGRGGEFLLAGRDAVLETIGGIDVELGATTFLQVNPGAAALLYEEVAAALRAGGPAPARVLDLYCGVGLQSLAALDDRTEVVGVEMHAGTVERARRAAARAGRTNATFAAADAVTFAQRAAAAGERFDAVVLNPPRTGAGPGLAEAVAALAPRTVVVVSCHPAALARDLARLRASGFTPAEIAGVDMFPQTPHLEAVARLQRTADVTA